MLQVSIIPTKSKEFKNKSKEISIVFSRCSFCFCENNLHLKFPENKMFLTLILIKFPFSVIAEYIGLFVILSKTPCYFCQLLSLCFFFKTIVKIIGHVVRCSIWIHPMVTLTLVWSSWLGLKILQPNENSSQLWWTELVLSNKHLHVISLPS